MQQHDGARLQLAEIFQHAGEIQAVALRIVVAVLEQFETRGAKHHMMVAPARVADRNLRTRASHLLDQVRRHAQCGTAADGLRGCHAPGRQQRGLGTKQQLLGQLRIRRQAVDRQVAAWLACRHEGLLHFMHGGQQRDAALFIDVDAHPKVDLARAAVGQIGLGQAQDRIARSHFNRCKEGHSGYSTR